MKLKICKIISAICFGINMDAALASGPLAKIEYGMHYAPYFDPLDLLRYRALNKSIRKVLLELLGYPPERTVLATLEWDHMEGKALSLCKKFNIPLTINPSRSYYGVSRYIEKSIKEKIPVAFIMVLGALSRDYFYDKDLYLKEIIADRGMEWFSEKDAEFYQKTILNQCNKAVREPLKITISIDIMKDALDESESWSSFIGWIIEKTNQENQENKEKMRLEIHLETCISFQEDLGDEKKWKIPVLRLKGYPKHKVYSDWVHAINTKYRVYSDWVHAINTKSIEALHLYDIHSTPYEILRKQCPNLQLLCMYNTTIEKEGIQYLVKNKSKRGQPAIYKFLDNIESKSIESEKTKVTKIQTLE